MTRTIIEQSYYSRPDIFFSFVPLGHRHKGHRYDRTLLHGKAKIKLYFVSA